MLNRNLFFAACLSALASTACAETEARKTPQVASHKATSDLKHLTQTAALIIIAEVKPALPTENSAIKLPQNTPNPQIDFEKERDRAREATEETARTFSGLDVGPLVQLQTIETLKGPSTATLSIAASTEALKNAKPGQLFLIFMGSNHPDAIKPIKSRNDPWVEQVKNALAE